MPGPKGNGLGGPDVWLKKASSRHYTILELGGGRGRAAPLHGGILEGNSKRKKKFLLYLLSPHSAPVAAIKQRKEERKLV